MSKLLLAVSVCVSVALTGAATVLAASTTAFRGDAHMGKRASAVTFRLAGDNVVDFQLDRLDVQQMRIEHGGRFAGCNTREAAHPCVIGVFDTARDRATGTVTFGKHGRWTWTARALGTIPTH